MIQKATKDQTNTQSSSSSSSAPPPHPPPTLQPHPLTLHHPGLHFASPFPPYPMPAYIPAPMVHPETIMNHNANYENMLQNHRRKMLRRAANRKSAQLSRARKKAHLEELKTENIRLQRMVDILDSQPELVFCITANGKITYISDKTMNFMKINFTSDDIDEDPTHLSQLLSKESVVEVLDSVTRLQQSCLAMNNDNELNMLFSVKMVHFQDTIGRSVIGYLRCSKIYRRSPFMDLPTPEATEKPSAPPQKKSKKSNPNSNETSNKESKQVKLNPGKNQEEEAPPPPPPLVRGDEKSGWNMTNFHLLADCVSALTTDKAEDKNENLKRSFGESSSENLEQKNSNPEMEPPTILSPASTSEKFDDEFICVIRTADNYFVPYRSTSDILMFSALSTASIHAHDLESRGLSTTTNSNNNRISASPCISNNSNSDSKTHSDQNKTSNASESGSDDTNTGEMDST